MESDAVTDLGAHFRAAADRDPGRRLQHQRRLATRWPSLSAVQPGNSEHDPTQPTRHLVDGRRHQLCSSHGSRELPRAAILPARTARRLPDAERRGREGAGAPIPARRRGPRSRHARHCVQPEQGRHLGCHREARLVVSHRHSPEIHDLRVSRGGIRWHDRHTQLA